MWSGIITINNIKASVTIEENTENGWKTIYGQGKSEQDIRSCLSEIMDTRIGKILINYVGESGTYFTFKMTGEPKISI